MYPRPLQNSDRRLAAIMFTDMVGYTSLSQKNEAEALELLEEHRRILRSIFPKYKGEEIKTIGDSFLVEFSSALDALKCAFEIQQYLHEFNESRPLETGLRLRVGIHLGDVVHEKGDVYGDAVNIASRVEPLAESGGICITQQVFDQVRNKVQFPISHLGTRKLKNVELPLEIYSIVPASLKKKSLTSSASQQDRIAVLPLTSISPDPADEYFADGLTEELISAISRIKDLTVIARTSVMRYKGATKSVSEIGNELNVASVLEGSVRKAQNRLRITVQQINTETEGHLWSENYDREMNDIFAIQSEIAEHVASALELNLRPEEKKIIRNRAATESAEAYTLYLKGLHFWNERTEEGLKKSIMYYDQALAKDPNHALSYAGLAGSYAILGDYGILPVNEAIPKAKTFAKKALELNDALAEPHAFLATVSFYEWDVNGTVSELKQAIRLNPNYATAHHWYSFILQYRKQKNEALSEIDRAKQLDPYSPIINTAYCATFFNFREYDRAIEELNKALEVFPDFWNLHDYLGGALMAKSRYAEAIAEFEKAVRLSGDSPVVKDNLAHAYALSGRVSDAIEILEEISEISKQNYVNPLTFAIIYCGLGKKDEALEWLNRAVEERSGNILQAVAFDPMLDSVRDDPRFVALLEKLPA